MTKEGGTIKVLSSYRFALEGIHVVDVPLGVQEVGHGPGQVHPDAARWGVENGRAEAGGQRKAASTSKTQSGTDTTTAQQGQQDALPPGVEALENHHYLLPDGSKVHGKRAMQEGVEFAREKAAALDVQLGKLEEPAALDQLQAETEPERLGLYRVQEFGRDGGPRESVLQGIQVRQAELAESPAGGGNGSPAE